MRVIHAVATEARPARVAVVTAHLLDGPLERVGQDLLASDLVPDVFVDPELGAVLVQ